MGTQIHGFGKLLPGLNFDESWLLHFWRWHYQRLKEAKELDCHGRKWNLGNILLDLAN